MSSGAVMRTPPPVGGTDPAIAPGLFARPAAAAAAVSARHRAVPGGLLPAGRSGALPRPDLRLPARRQAFGVVALIQGGEVRREARRCAEPGLPGRVVDWRQRQTGILRCAAAAPLRLQGDPPGQRRRPVARRCGAAGRRAAPQPCPELQPCAGALGVRDRDAGAARQHPLLHATPARRCRLAGQPLERDHCRSRWRPARS